MWVGDPSSPKQQTVLRRSTITTTTRAGILRLRPHLPLALPVSSSAIAVLVTIVAPMIGLLSSVGNPSVGRASAFAAGPASTLVATTTTRVMVSCVSSAINPVSEGTGRSQRPSSCRATSGVFRIRSSSAIAMSSSSTTTTTTPDATATTASARTAESQTGAVELAHVEFFGGGSKESATSDHEVSRRRGDELWLPPVLLLHGLLGNKRNFATVANSLKNQLHHGRSRRLIGLDLRNHGENHHDWRQDMTYPSMAHDVISWLDRHQIDKAVLVGHSMGGKVAQAVALLYPHRVDGLVVLDIAPVRYAREADPSWKAVGDIVSVLASLEVQPGASRSHVDQQLRSTVPDPALRAFCLTNLDPKAGRWKIPLDTIASNLHHLADFDLSSAAQSDGEKQHHQYLGDAFFIHGGQSRFVRSSHIPTIASYFPNHLLTTVRGAGHWIHAEAPDDTTALLKKFLDR